MAKNRTEILYESPTLRFELHTLKRSMGPGLYSVVRTWEKLHGDLWSTSLIGGSATVASQMDAKGTQANIDRLHTVSREPAMAHVAQRLSALARETAEEQNHARGT